MQAALQTLLSLLWRHDMTHQKVLLSFCSGKEPSLVDLQDQWRTAMTGLVPDRYAHTPCSAQQHAAGPEYDSLQLAMVHILVQCHMPDKTIMTSDNISP